MAILKRVLAGLHHTAFGLRYAARSSAWLPAQSRPRPPLDKVLISGFFNEALGIGRAGALVANGLESRGVAVDREDLRPFDRGLLTRRPSQMPSDAPVWLIHANPPEARIALFTHDGWQDCYRIGYWAWESSRAPEAWAQTATWFHEIWVPSGFVREAVAAILPPNEAAKLKVVPTPVRVPAVAERKAGPITALTLFDPRSSFVRKNPAGAIQAWMRAVPTPGDARLMVKTLSRAEIHPQFQALQALAGGRGDIVFMAQTLDNDATAQLIADCDILISLHRGEGYGLPLAEAMAAGKAVLATGWSGNLEFMTPDNSVPVPYRLVPADSGYNGPQAQWADPDIDAAAAALRNLIDDTDLRYRLGNQARNDATKLRDGWLSL
ncbi:lpsE protein [Asticcacaulis biprosthecium C19]|uniref:LpsE protein n=1 Tax=Asticcacaulis biprosthecium C19 TaxID=715226 RepID=F4QLZ3_9CAUL|nr:glycosyltransferase [Asticcacaulis biprosthecium]EGF93565.1 lpsE protein [Asticcacaulis biprosthecium C19]